MPQKKMKTNLKFFKNSKKLPTDIFFQNVLYDKKIGYYNTKQPFGRTGDFITAPKISFLFSEMIAIWVISTWENFGKPKNVNIVELGPGDGSLTKVLIKVFKKFPNFNSAKKIYLYEDSDFLKKIQKKNLKNNNIKWINSFKKLKKGPIIFFGNEFFDAIPIKQFKRDKNLLLEKYYEIDKNYNISEKYYKAMKIDKRAINQFKTFYKQSFIEYPKIGLDIMKKVIKKIIKYKGCILIVDYGFYKPNNQNTLQSVINHKKNLLFKNLGKADVTSHVNFELLHEFFFKNSLSVNKVISQKEFLEKMGILQRAEIIAKNLKFNDQSNLYLRLKRLLSPRLMGELFKVISAYKF